MRPYRPTAWITHPDCFRHDNGPLHPECARRLEAIADRLRITGLWDFLQHHAAPEASRQQLLRVHRVTLYEQLTANHSRGVSVALDADTVQGEHSLKAALRAAGAGVKAVDLALAGDCGLAFCAVRPPGHHCERDRAMGFCFFNNIAVAAAHALAQGLRRIAIVDFDLHYGNGTADIFAGDDRVWLFSTYQHPLYPHWTGAPEARNLIDVPLSAYSGGSALREAVTERWLPVLKTLRPELILVSAGFDAHADDPLGDLRWSTADYRWLGQMIAELAEASCQGRVVASLEGGYDPQALARSVEAFLLPFLGESLPA